MQVVNCGAREHSGERTIEISGCGALNLPSLSHFLTVYWVVIRKFFKIIFIFIFINIFIIKLLKECPKPYCVQRKGVFRDLFHISAQQPTGNSDLNITLQQQQNP